MNLNVEVSDKNFRLFREGLGLENGKQYEYAEARHFLENKMKDAIHGIINATYAHCAHCDEVFIKKRKNHILCQRCSR